MVLDPSIVENDVASSVVETYSFFEGLELVVK